MNEVFIKKSDAQEPGFNVGVLLRRKETLGEVGVEIEVEGNKFPKPEGYEGTHTAVQLQGTNYWSYVHDGSLRGQDNAEYILRKPVAFSVFPDTVAELFGKLASYGSVIEESNRTSVHVHLNCQRFHLNRLTSLMALYFTFEEVLTAWCGEHRVGNLFCLRAKDAPAIISQIRRFIKTDGTTELRDHLHYAGLNANALHKFGSLEFRSLRGCTNPQVILDWVSILQRLYELSAEFEDPRDICGMFSQSGPLAFFDTILGDRAGIVRQGITMDNDEIAESMYTGIRLAQDLCYCRDWTLFKAMDIKADPFGRDMRKVMKKITGLAQGLDVGAALASLDDAQPVSIAPAPAPTASQIFGQFGGTQAVPQTPATTYWASPQDTWESPFNPFNMSEQDEG